MFKCSVGHVWEDCTCGPAVGQETRSRAFAYALIAAAAVVAVVFVTVAVAR